MQSVLQTCLLARMGQHAEDIHQYVLQRNRQVLVKLAGQLNAGQLRKVKLQFMYFSSFPPALPHQ